MSKATIYSTAQYGLADDSSATGLHVGNVSFTAGSDLAEVPDHIGCVVGFAIYNEKVDVSVDGIVKTKGTGLVPNMAAVLTLAESSNNSRTKLSETVSGTPDANAGIVVTGADLKPTQSGFEGGSITGVYYPFVATNSPATLT